MHACMHACMYVRVCVYIYIYICIYVCIYIYIYMYTNTCILLVFCFCCRGLSLSLSLTRVRPLLPAHGRRRRGRGAQGRGPPHLADAAAPPRGSDPADPASPPPPRCGLCAKAVPLTRPLPVSEKATHLEMIMSWKDKPSECQIRGWRAISASGLQGRSSPNSFFLFTDTGLRGNHVAG